MQKQTFQWKNLTMGTCYYPEHWPKEQWEQDLERMLDAGITCIRIGEFAWAMLEPEEGVFDFSFFKEFLDLCQAHGMQVIFGTPTATPPAWLTERYPEVLNALKDGTLLRHGARRHYNYNSPVYRRLCARIVEEEARALAAHPAIVGWQIDNELNCETDVFYSEADHTAFRDWCRKKYGTLDALNRAWGTVFWSETYSSWEQVYGPRPVLNHGDNPHLLLDYCRFISDSCVEFASLQAQILRKYAKPGDYITTNGIFGNLDSHRLQNEVLDVFTYDSYPDFAFELGRNPAASRDLNDRKWTRNLTLVRSVCPHFGIMEQQSGPGGWSSRMEMPAPRPGQLKLWAMQSVAAGADFISFFRWRTCTFGTEMYWHGILDYDSRDNRRLKEVREFGQMLRAIDPVCGAENVPAFALLKDWDNECDMRSDVWHERIGKYSESEIFAAAEENHTPYDIVFLRDETDPAELSRFPVVFAPHPCIMTQKRKDVLEAYVQNGGTLVIGCRAGLKDMDGHCVTEPLPGLLSGLTGTDITDFSYRSPAEAASMRAPLFVEVLNPHEGTEVVWRHEDSYCEGEPLLTKRKLGRGQVLHLGSCFSRENTKELFALTGILEPFGGALEAPVTVQLVLRRKGDAYYLFCLNYSDREQEISCHTALSSLLSGEKREGHFVLPPYGIEVLEVPAEYACEYAWKVRR